MVFVSSADAEANRKLAEEHALKCPILLMKESESLAAFQNMGTTSAYLDPHLNASGKKLILKSAINCMSKTSDLRKKVQAAYKQGWLWSAIRHKVRPYLRGLKYVVHSPASRLLSLHSPEYVQPNANEQKVVERIFNSFKRMKEDQAKIGSRYLPSPMWQQILEDAYSSLNQNDINKFHYFLANFGAWDRYNGVEFNTLIRNHAKSFIKRRYCENEIFYHQLKIWRWFATNRKPVSRLDQPTFGNQSGAYIDGVFVGVGSFFTEIYGSMLAELIHDLDHPIVAELGAGYGRLAYFTLRDVADFVFIDFDLPETLCLAAYWLMQVYPNKIALLYGEEEYSSVSHEKYELIFMPSWEITKVGPSTVDLFINTNSLGEMTQTAARNYIAYITKATRWFFHMNHEITRNTYDDADQGLLAYEYPVPMDKFDLLFRYPEMGHLLFQGFLDFHMDIFLYLYERKNSKV